MPTRWIGMLVGSSPCSICSSATLAFLISSSSVRSSRPLWLASGALSMRTWQAQALPHARVVACIRGRCTPAAAASAYVKGGDGATVAGLGRDCFLVTLAISEAAGAASAAMSMRYWSDMAVLSVNSSTVLVMLTADPCRSFVVHLRSAMVTVSCLVAGCMKFVMASATLAAELSMHKPLSIITIALSSSTTTFDSAMVWDRWSNTKLSFAGLYVRETPVFHMSESFRDDLRGCEGDQKFSHPA